MQEYVFYNRNPEKFDINDIDKVDGLKTFKMIFYP